MGFLIQILLIILYYIFELDNFKNHWSFDKVMGKNVF